MKHLLIAILFFSISILIFILSIRLFSPPKEGLEINEIVILEPKAASIPKDLPPFDATKAPKKYPIKETAI